MLQEVIQQRHNIGETKGIAHAHAQRAGRFAGSASKVCDRRLDGDETSTDFCQETLSGLGQGQMTCTTVKQSYPNACFQFGYVLAHGCRCQAKPSPRFGKAARFGATHKAFNAV